MVIKAGGKSYVRSPPAFSNDAGKVLVCTGNTVSVFSSSTGLLVSELEGHTAAVTSVMVVPGDAPASRMLCQCWTASLDGTIKFWEFPDLVKTISIGLPIHYMVIPGLLLTVAGDAEKPADIYAYIFVEAVSKDSTKQGSIHYQIRKVNLTKSKVLKGKTLLETDKPRPLVVSPSGNYIGFCNKQTLHAWEIPRKDSDGSVLKKVKLHHTKKLTSLAFHPTERIVAAGDVTGRILIWRGVGRSNSSVHGNKLSKGASRRNVDERPGVINDDDADSCTTWHWHSTQVNLLFFSTDGAYLYSGGHEGVLVLWQLETGKKKFLPRIEAPLRYFTISPDPSLSSVSCSDNRIHLLQMPSMSILRTISGIKPPTSFMDMAERSCCRVAVTHSKGLAAVPTESYGVQLFSLLNDREICEVRVCERNHQPGDEFTVVVNMVSLSPDGSNMATVERRLPEEGIGGLVSLKFWEFNPQSKDFSLSTVVYEPHRESDVSGLAFNPIHKMAVTSSYGADFKIWACRSGASQEEQKPQKNGWTCHAVGSYKNKPMTAAAFSADGSVLAVAAENVITLWDPERNILVAVIGESIEPIVSLAFVGKSDHLVSASRGSHPELTLWSMSKLSVSWSYKLLAEAISCATDSSSFAVLALLPQSPVQGVDGLIMLFGVDKAVPVSTWFVRKAQGGTLGFLQADSSLLEDCPELLTYINGEHEYAIIDPSGQHDKIQLRDPSQINLEETGGRFGYESLYGELPEFKLENGGDEIMVTAESGNAWKFIINGPSHDLPPYDKLCIAFHESMLERIVR